MATTNYSWATPVVGGSADTWGTILNALFQSIDTQVFAMVPKAGTTLTGALIGVTPAAGANGYASFRFPQGAAPTTNLTNGDHWMTSGGFFYRRAGGTKTIAELEGAAFTGAVSFASTVLLAADPTLSLQAATKQYVDNLASGLKIKAAADRATTANITLSGEQTIDGTLTSASRILVRSQTAPAENGIYTTGAGAWTRATDMDAWDTEVPGALCYVSGGSTLAGKRYYCSSVAGGTLNTTAITWIEYDSTTLYTASGGITLTTANFALTNMAESTIKGRAASSGTGAPIDLTATQATAILNAVVGDSGAGGTKGLVPAPATGDALKTLRGDGTFAGYSAAAYGCGSNSGSTMSFTGSKGISSFSRSSNGKWILTLNPARTDTNWAALFTPGYASGSLFASIDPAIVTKSTTQVGVQFRTAGNTLQDPDTINIVVFG